MMITSITPQRDPERVNIYLDGEFAFGINILTMANFGLKKGMEIDETMIQSILESDEYQKAKSKAFDYLSYRQRTTKEMESYLLRKEFNHETVSRVLQDLLDSGYLNDLDFAETFVRDRSTYKNHGPFRIKNDLLQKGISTHVADEAMEEYGQDLERIAEEVQKKYSSIIHEKSDKRIRRVGGYLQRRGHSYDTIRKVLDLIDRKDE